MVPLWFLVAISLLIFVACGLLIFQEVAEISGFLYRWLKAEPERKLTTSHKLELGIEGLLGVLLFAYPYGAEQMELPHNFWLGLGSWVAALAIAIRMFWIFPWWEARLSRLQKTTISAMAIVVIVFLAWKPVHVAYQSISATQLGIQLMSEISGDAKSPITGLFLILRNLADRPDEHIYIRVFVPQIVKKIIVDNPDRVQIISGPEGKDPWREFGFELSVPELAGHEIRIIQVEMAPPTKAGDYMAHMSSGRCKGECENVLIFGPYIIGEVKHH